MVKATLAACEPLLAAFAKPKHLFLVSGACLPLRPVVDLMVYLAAHPTPDFIESVRLSAVPRSIGSLEQDRFALRFPFARKRHRRLFDLSVIVERAPCLTRRPHNNLVPHLGRSGWCLARTTLTAVLTDPKRQEHARYFRRVWSPDESYFQTLVRLHSAKHESRSLTFAQFDAKGKLHVFYDDHLDVLRQSQYFIGAKKLGWGANHLYDTPHNRTTRMRRPIAQRPYRKPLFVWFPPPRPLHSPVARTLHAKPVSFIGQTQPYNGLEIYRI